VSETYECKQARIGTISTWITDAINSE
jgi:hypothetical protein